MSDRVMACYQDRAECPRCGTLLERWCSTAEDGRTVNLPVLFPLSRFSGPYNYAVDVETVRMQFTSGGREQTREVEYVRLAMFCPTCNMDLPRSWARIHKGSLPDYAFTDRAEPRPMPAAVQEFTERLAV